MARPLHTRHADDLTRAHAHRDVQEVGVARQGVHLEQGLAIRPRDRLSPLRRRLDPLERFDRAGRLVVAERAVLGHQRDDLVPVEFRPGERADGVTVTKDRDPVGDAQDLGQPVAHVDDRLLLVAQHVQALQHRRGVVLRQGGVGLVQQDDVAGMQQRPADLGEPQFRHAQLTGRGGLAERGAAEIQRLPGEPAVPGAELALAVEGPFEAQQHVAPDAEVGHRLHLLGHVADAPPLGVPEPMEHHLGLVEPDVAGVGADHPGQDLHQRRLAGAVLAQQGVHLAAPYVQGHVVERLHARERLGDALQAGRGGFAGRALCRRGARVRPGCGLSRCHRRRGPPPEPGPVARGSRRDGPGPAVAGTPAPRRTSCGCALPGPG